MSYYHVNKTMGSCNNEKASDNAFIYRERDIYILSKKKKKKEKRFPSNFLSFILICLDLSYWFISKTYEDNKNNNLK